MRKFQTNRLSESRMDKIALFEKTAIIICAILTLLIPQKALTQEPEETIFLHYWTGSLSGGINEMVTAFNQKYPTFNVRATGFEHESFKIGIKVMLAGGNPPDLFSYWAGARTQALVDQNYLSPIDDLWEKANLGERCRDRERRREANANPV